MISYEEDECGSGNAKIKLVNGDCLGAMANLASNSVDFVVTDPPYFMDGMGDDWDDSKLVKKTAKAGVVGGLPVGMKFDPRQGKRLQEFFGKVSKEAIRVLKPGGFFVSFCLGRLYHRMTVAAEDEGFEIRDMGIWEHNGGQAKSFSQNHFVMKRKNLSPQEKEKIITSMDGRKTPQLRPEFEPFMIGQKPKEGTFVDNWIKHGVGLLDMSYDASGKVPTTIFRHKKPKTGKKFKHFTVKPVGLIEELITIFTKKGDIVVDPFLGSGTTVIASISSDRNFWGCERDKSHYENAKRRITDE